jgi:hypothetical protein
MLENVAYSTNGVDQRMRSLMVHLTAQPINVDIHDVGCRVNPHSPNVVENHGASDHTTFIATKILQK